MENTEDKVEYVVDFEAHVKANNLVLQDNGDYKFPDGE
jgi:hypothetical protein